VALTALESNLGTTRAEKRYGQRKEDIERVGGAGTPA